MKTFSYQVRTYHTDASERLFVHQILNYLQDAAHLHANSEGFGQADLWSIKKFWVLSRLNIEIERLPILDDEILVKTWVKASKGAQSEREYSISIGDEVAINASSLWYCMSTDTLRPTEVPDQVLSIMQPHDVYATRNGTVKVLKNEETSERSIGVKMKVVYTDIDMVDHVNNVSYIKWITNESPFFNMPDKKIKSLNINYLAQSFIGDQVEVFHFKESVETVFHEVKHADKGTSLCKVKTEWW
jgi:acyl-ACP thioesterase